jgi:outer membrane protein TolC
MALTLDQAIQQALDASPTIAKQKALVGVAKASKDQALSEFIPHIAATYTHTNRDDATSFQERTSYNYAIVGTYNLFNGFSDLALLKKAKLDSEIATLQEKATRADLIFEVTSAFIQALKAQQAYALQNEAVELLQEQYNDATTRFTLGMIAKHELLQVDVALQSSLHNQLRAQSDLNNARTELNRILGGGLKADEYLVSLPTLVPSITTYPVLLKQMFANRSEWYALAKSLEAKQQTLKSTQGNYYPTVDLSYTYRINDKRQGSSTQTFQLKNESVITVNVSWDLYSGGYQQATILADRHAINALIAQQNELRLNLEAQLQQTIEAKKLAQNLLNVAKKAQQSAEENYRIVMEKNSIETMDRITLLDARVDLSSAKEKVYQAKLDIALAQAKLKRIIEE